MNNIPSPKRKAEDASRDEWIVLYKIGTGRSFRCTECMTRVDIVEMDSSQETFPYCGSKEFSVMDEDDYITDANEIVYIIDDDGTLLGGRIVNNFGGVRITVDTESEKIYAECEDELWRESTPHDCEELNDALRRRWNGRHRNERIRGRWM